ncbi:MAG: class I SAM-dependent methyltransferase [Alkalinema sp. RU_4_3]|nr:class I SAM-dependent methyltransferase [Alkalinema sp. RU_4_3]
MFNPYSQLLFPRLMDAAMSGEALGSHRRSLLADVTGETLEIGFGTGLNLPHYPKTLTHLIAIDSNSGMKTLAEKRIAASGIAVDRRTLSGESLPMDDDSFDSVVSTWTLCSIAGIERAIAEVHRVLKPGGKFFFIEHGLSRNSRIQPWQKRLTPIQRILGDGCHLDRNIRHFVEAQFTQLQLEEFPEPSLPEVMGYFYKGFATK